MSDVCINNQPHRRYNPLLDEWILVSPHRTTRPWQGQVEVADRKVRPSYEPDCYLCPGNARANGEKNKNYTSTFAFTNDFAALKNEATPIYRSDGLLKAKTERGESRVICYSPDHSKTLPHLQIAEIEKVIITWQEQCNELSKQYKWIQIFENKGSIMGCSNPHPHGQIWAQENLPSLVYRKQSNQKKHFEETGSNLLQVYVHQEMSSKERIVAENSEWLVVVPYWAAWPFETLVLPKFQVARMTELNKEQRLSLAKILKELTVLYDNLFQCSFPYSMGWHGAPYDNKIHAEWTLHASFFPPLLRSAQVKKFMVGYELMAETQRDLTPELAATRLREQSAIHYQESQ